MDTAREVRDSHAGQASAIANRTPTRVHIRAALLVTAVWAVSLATLVPMWLGIARCPFVTLFHAPCPGCGMTRALLALGHGDPGGSFALHPLAVPTALTQIAVAVATIVLALRRGSPFYVWSIRWGKIVLGAAALVVLSDVVLWIARALGAFGGPVPV